MKKANKKKAIVAAVAALILAILGLLEATGVDPVELEGTFPLPESQLDRFLMRLSIGYPARHEELELLKIGGVEPELEQA